MNKTAKHFLLELGLSPSSVCFWYGLAALEIVQQDPPSMICLSKCVFPQIAEIYHVTPEAVESGLRRAIVICWQRNRSMLEKLVGGECKKPPTIRRVLAAVLINQQCPKNLEWFL